MKSKRREKKEAALFVPHPCDDCPRTEEKTFCPQLCFALDEYSCLIKKKSEGRLKKSDVEHYVKDALFTGGEVET